MSVSPARVKCACARRRQAEVRGLKVGDRVTYAGPTGGYSDVRLIETDRLVELPKAISFEQEARATSGSTILTI